MADANDWSLELENLSVRYEAEEILHGVSHRVRRGAWLGVIGPNGAGKSTLLRSLARLVRFSGLIKVNGHDETSLSRRALARLVAYVPQSPELPQQMSALDYVVLGRLPHLGYFGGHSSSDREHCAQLLESLDLGAKVGRLLGELSGGEVQRLVLARALAQDAPILLLDEPTSALDLGRRVDALELVDSLREARGLTVVSALHDLTLASQFAGELLLLHEGAVVASGTPDEVLEEASLGRFFGASVQVLRGVDGELVVIPRRRVEGTS